ncbi:MAG: hypothetical protein QOD81_1430 [Solirubrobacteraceae bacterium]|nr:hypothetical protein [Solirubrobacteraceae bacterium]
MTQPGTAGGHSARRALGRWSIAAALAASAVATAPAHAEQTGVGVTAGHSVSVFHNLDFVAALGHPRDADVQVDVWRGSHRIGTARGPAGGLANATPDAIGLEVNHAPAGAPAPGECWTGHTPDIVPGDRIVVREYDADAVTVTSTDEVTVDRIRIDSAPEELSNGDIVVRGIAERVDGTPIDVASLDSGEFRNGGFRGSPDRVVRTSGTRSGWTAVYEKPYDGRTTPFRNRDNLDEAARKRALLGATHAMGFGHLVPGPDAQVFDGVDTPGPVAGCTAPRQSNAVKTLSTSLIQPGASGLTVGGTAMAAVLAPDPAATPADVIGAAVSLDDGVTPPVTSAATGLAAGATAEQSWTAAFTAEQLAGLADGPITVSATYAVAGSPELLTGKSLTIRKGAPPVPDTPSGTGPGSGGGSPNAGPGGPQGSTAPTPASPAPLAVAGAGPAGPSASLPVVAAALAGPAPPALRILGVRLSASVSLAAVRRRGIAMSFAAPSGSVVAQARLYERRGAARRLVATRTVAVRAGRRGTVRFADARLRRRLRSGRYELTIRTGATLASLGPAVTRRVRIAR